MKDLIEHKKRLGARIGLGDEIIPKPGKMKTGGMKESIEHN